MTEKSEYCISYHHHSVFGGPVEGIFYRHSKIVHVYDDGEAKRKNFGNGIADFRISI